MADEKILNEAESYEELKKKLAAAEKKIKAAEKKAEDAEKQLATAGAAAEKDAANQEKSIKNILDAEEKVTIQLFKDDDKYNSDLFVAINGMTYQIKRGVPVEVPKSVANVIQLSQNQDINTATRLESLAKKLGDEALR